MVNSMTGYGRGEFSNEAFKMVVEMRSVNSRYLELSCRMPRHINPLEERVKKQIQAVLTRGKVDVYITLEEQGEKSKEVKLDQELCFKYYRALNEVSALCGMTERADLATIANLPGVFTVEKADTDLDLVWQALEPALTEALAGMATMRQAEGQKLALDLLSRKAVMEGYLAKVQQQAPLVVKAYQSKLQERIAELVSPEVVVDPNRLALEVAVFADKCAIDEEMVRLESHLQQLAVMAQATEPVGRKLDFLLQELNREVNTIGSKANDLQLSDTVIAMKAELEKIREQVQNIE